MGQEIEEYYTPNESELFIGWVGERNVIKFSKDCYTFPEDFKLAQSEINKGDKVWIPITLESVNSDHIKDIKNGDLRCSILCKQDIIDLNWEAIKDNYFEMSFPNIDDYSFSLKILNDKNRDGSKSIEIKHIGGFDTTTIFYGKCKSKNELFKLMKDYLNIPI